MLKPMDLFELSNFEHANIFHNCDYVWQAISNISKYLDSWNLWSLDGTIETGAFLSGDIYLHKDALVESGAYIKGPCIIGAGSEIRNGAYIRGNVIVGRNCVVGHSTEVKNSMFMDDAKAGHFAYVGDSILGNHVNLGAGTKLANLKIVPGNVSISYQNQTYDTGLRKLGAIIGDYAQTGCNSVTSPGVIIGRYTLIYPALSVKGVIESAMVVKPAQEPNVEPIPARIFNKIK